MSVKKSDLLIGGQMCPPTSGQYYPLYSPVDGTLVAEVADASRADVERAAAAAREAFYAEWKFCGIEHKRALFAKLKEVLYAMADELADAKVQPQGGPGIPPLVERVISYYVGKLDDGAGTLIEHGDQSTNYVYREPLGVVAIFAPFNGPMLASLLSAVPALVAGNTVVLKAPDQEAPQALKTMQAFHEAGFPAGVVNALSGKGPEVGQALVAHPATRLISFTGSTATGKKIMAAAAVDLKRVAAKSGQQNSADRLARRRLGSSGDSDRGIGLPRAGVLGHKSGFAARIATRRIYRFAKRKGTGRRAQHVDRPGGGRARGSATSRWAKHRGLCCLVAHSRWELSTRRVAILSPTAFAFADQSLSGLPRRNFRPGCLRADVCQRRRGAGVGQRYGLRDCSFRSGPEEAERQRYFVRRLEVGIVAINSASMLSHRTPWGGFKQSGIGRRYGELGLEPFFEYKTVWISLKGN